MRAQVEAEGQARLDEPPRAAANIHRSKLT
jgi:hypothetical protein